MFGEILVCQFPFTSGTVSKVRPALMLCDLGPDVLICRVTSVQRPGPLDVNLIDWREAGLIKPSVARLDRLITAERSTVVSRRLGVLSAADQKTIARIGTSKCSFERARNALVDTITTG